MIARVVPALKLPARFNYLDYQIPRGLMVAPGDFVRVPFRGRKALGVVLAVMREPDSLRYRLKPIADVIDGIRFSLALLTVLSESAAQIKSNLPFLLRALVPDLPERRKRV